MNNLIKYGAGEKQFAQAQLYKNMFLARVISQYNDIYKIETESGTQLAEVSGKFRYDTVYMSDYPAVGDFVMVDRIDLNSGNAIIHNVLPRKSIFERSSNEYLNQTQVIATNVDIVFICMSLNNNYNLSRLERYISVAWSSGAVPVVVLTKSDLCNDIPKVLQEISNVAIGVDVLITSGFECNSCDKLIDYLKPGVTASFVGSSGVGKSTLINCLAGEDLLLTSEIRCDDKGRHTTTRRELLVLPQGGIVIDTPGMREFGVETVDLSATFSDIDELSKACRFSDCTHINEPGCAIKLAIEEGRLDKRRLENYLKLKREASYDGLSSKEIESKKLDFMFKDFGGIKNAKKYIKNNKNKKL